MSEDTLIYCSFCGLPRFECKRIIAGENGVHICENCVLDCVHILFEDSNQNESEGQKQDKE